MTPEKLVELAIQARENAYCPYSCWAVGAALLTKGGKVYLGCNIENGGFTATNCAERTAFFKAVSEGEREFAAIAVVGGKEGDPDGTAFPCGVCRQVMMEFCNPETFKIYMAADLENFDEATLAELLPRGFGAANLA